jgi:methyl-accepting chemotaxis protein
VKDDPGYQAVIAYFRRIVDRDPTILEAFFATDNTQEYFNASEERIEVEGYLVKNRPWWHEAVAEDRLYLTSPIRSATTGIVSVTAQTTVYLDDGRFLGVGGVDVQITTVEDLVGRITFQDEGTAFLVNEDQEIIVFPGLDLDLGTDLASLDDLEDVSAAGFADLATRLRERTTDPLQVRWRGEPMIALVAPVQLEKPAVDWTLSLLVPERMIGGPIRRARLTSVLAVLVTIAAVCAMTLLVTRSVVTRPLRRLGDRLRDIAGGQGDLTRRLEVTGHDEISELGASFNAFADRIQADVRSIGEQAGSLATSSDDLSTLSQQMASTTEETSAQATVVSSAAEEVSTNVQAVATASEQMNASIREIAHAAHDAADVATDAVRIASDTSATFERLEKSGAAIDDIIRVISSVAEQTNLLALNATIEAARAGEAGRGFAIVAGEVKKLASQTADATEEIGSSIASIQADTRTAADAVRRIRAIIDSIHDTQTTIATSVEQQTATAAEISRSVSEVAKGNSEIAESTSGIAQAIQESASAAASLREAADELAGLSDRLRAIVGRFTY